MQRYYYGWNVVGLTLVAQMLVVGATYSSFGLFVKPVSAELNLSRADMNTALILFNIGTGLLAPFVGRLLDRFPVRRIFVFCVLCLGGSLIALGLSRSVWLSAGLMVGPVAAGGLGAGALTASVMIARWFAAQRGRAMAISAIGMSLGHLAVAPVAGWLIETQGWRSALVLVGVGVTAILLTLSLFIRERPGPDDRETGPQRPDEAAPQREAAAPEAPAKVTTILAMPQFWLIGLSAAVAMAVSKAVLVTLPPLALDSGLSMMQATSLVSIAGGAAIAGKLLLAVIADKLERLYLFALLLCFGAGVNAALLASDSYPFLLGCALVYGLTTTTQTPVLYAVLADRFGAASYGTVRGLLAPINAVISAVAIRFSGEIFDRTGAYDLLFGLFVAVQLVAAVLIVAVRFTRPLVAVAPATAPA